MFLFFFRDDFQSNLIISAYFSVKVHHKQDSFENPFENFEYVITISSIALKSIVKVLTMLFITNIQIKMSNLYK